MALGIALFCVVVLLGLIPLGIQVEKASGDQAVAVNMASAILADVRSIPEDRAESPLFGIALPAAGQEDPVVTELHGTPFGEIGVPGEVEDPHFVFTIRALPPEEAIVYEPVRLLLEVGWPVRADNEPPDNTLKLYGTYNRGI